MARAFWHKRFELNELPMRVLHSAVHWSPRGSTAVMETFWTRVLTHKGLRGSYRCGGRFARSPEPRVH
jgi:hypothetical protein